MTNQAQCFKVHRALQSQPAPLMIAVTGGTGSGKSTFCGALSELGAHVISADQVARAVMAPGTSLHAALVASFGSGILDSSGQLNRKKLSRIVFANAANRNRINMLTHPVIRAESLQQLRQTEAPIAIYDVPLLLEANVLEDVSGALLITAPEEQRLQRICTRDNLDQATARQRMNAQYGDEELRKVVNIEVENGGTRAALTNCAGTVYEYLLGHVIAAGEASNA